MTVSDFADITKDTPGEEAHRADEAARGGRNVHGHITRATRAAATSAATASSTSSATRTACRPRSRSIEYDPNRTANIALLHYADGEKRYILAPSAWRWATRCIAGAARRHPAGQRAAAARTSRVGTVIHNVELKPGRGGQMIRSAGTCGQLMAKEGDYAQMRLPSGEVRKVLIDCRATVGQLGNIDHDIIRIGKAGRAAGWASAPPSAASP